MPDVPERLGVDREVEIDGCFLIKDKKYYRSLSWSTIKLSNSSLWGCKLISCIKEDNNLSSVLLLIDIVHPVVFSVMHEVD
jgi:hypothetical protein